MNDSKENHPMIHVVCRAKDGDVGLWLDGGLDYEQCLTTITEAMQNAQGYRGPIKITKVKGFKPFDVHKVPHRINDLLHVSHFIIEHSEWGRELLTECGGCLTRAEDIACKYMMTVSDLSQFGKILMQGLGIWSDKSGKELERKTAKSFQAKGGVTIIKTTSGYHIFGNDKYLQDVEQH